MRCKTLLAFNGKYGLESKRIFHSYYTTQVNIIIRNTERDTEEVFTPHGRRESPHPTGLGTPDSQGELKLPRDYPDGISLFYLPFTTPYDA